MKNYNKIINFSIFLLIFITIYLFSFNKMSYASNINYRDDGGIELYAEDLSSLTDEQFNKVVHITIQNNLPNDSILRLFEKCVNLESIGFSRCEVSSLTFLNPIIFNQNIDLFFGSSNVDFSNLNSSYIRSINIANSKVTNFKQIENIASLEQLGLDECYGYETLDFSKIPHLTSLALATYIEDFEQLISSIPNVTYLSLGGSNIQNKDTIYLKRLTGLKYLNLNQTYLTDIDFVKDLEELEVFILPWSVVDLSPIYELDNLKQLDWEAYTELFITQDLVDYLDRNDILHDKYNPDINDKITNILSDLGLTSETDPKEAMDKISNYIVENTSTDLDYTNIEGNLSDLDILIYHNMGVCYQHSIATYTLAKALGINDIYAVSGIFMNYTNPLTGEKDESVYSYEGHGWNIINYQGIWYGVDVAQMNDNSGRISDTLHSYNFWKNPLKDDEYDYNYAIEEYLDFNYYFAKRHVETDGIIKQTATYEFKDISGLDIKNHVIYNYNKNDTNATQLRNKVLSNYNSAYEDVDSDGKISTGDKLIISKNNIIVDTFTLSTESWEEPKNIHLGKITLEYSNYPNEKIDGMDISTLYYNSNNPLKVNIKGENYDNLSEYTAKLTIINMDTDEEIYNKNFVLTGNEINDGASFLIEGNILEPKEKEDNNIFYGSSQYLIFVNINEDERSIGINYILEQDNNEVKDDTIEKDKPGDSDEKSVPSENTEISENEIVNDISKKDSSSPKTGDNIILFIMIFVVSIFGIIITNKIIHNARNK